MRDLLVALRLALATCTTFAEQCVSTEHQGKMLAVCHEACLAAVVWVRAFATAADAKVVAYYTNTGPH